MSCPQVNSVRKNRIINYLSERGLLSRELATKRVTGRESGTLRKKNERSFRRRAKRGCMKVLEWLICQKLLLVYCQEITHMFRYAPLSITVLLGICWQNVSITFLISPYPFTTILIPIISSEPCFAMSLHILISSLQRTPSRTGSK